MMSIYRYADITDTYTKAVSDCLKSGLRIVIGDTGVESGEIAKTDFADGGDIVRVLVEKSTDGIGTHVFSISRKTFKNRQFTSLDALDNVLWNSHADDTETIATFYEIASGVYTDMDAYLEIVDKRSKRHARKPVRTVMNPSRVVPILRKRQGYKRVKEDDVLCVYRKDLSYGPRYVVLLSRKPSKKASDIVFLGA